MKLAKLVEKLEKDFINTNRLVNYYFFELFQLKMQIFKRSTIIVYISIKCRNTAVFQ